MAAPATMSPGPSSGPLGRAPVGLGLVGCGVIAETYAGALSGLDGARLVAVTDVDTLRGEGFAAAHGVPHDPSLDELLARDEVDVVCVCVPSGRHAEVGLAAARAGKHLVVEKPIDVTLGAARRLIDGAASAGVSLNVISQQRYNPGVQKAKALLEEGALGRPLVISVSVPWYRSQAYYDSAPWRGTWLLDGGGAFMNQGVHYADLLCWLFGPPEVTAATCATLAHDIEVEDIALALLRFGGGAVGTLEASTTAYPGGAVVLRVNASRGTMVLEDGALVRLEAQGPAPALGSGDHGALTMPHGHRAQLADALSALRHGRPPPVSGEDGYRALELVLEVYRAAGWGPGG
jgi:UDP-N-acetyl-2-amino-2-deoxyglucuronate dehydrogenase